MKRLFAAIAAVFCISAGAEAATVTLESDMVTCQAFAGAAADFDCRARLRFEYDPEPNQTNQLTGSSAQFSVLRDDGVLVAEQALETYEPFIIGGGCSEVCLFYSTDAQGRLTSLRGLSAFAGSITDLFLSYDLRPGSQIQNGFSFIWIGEFATSGLWALDDSRNPAPVPLPASAVGLGIALAGTIAVRRRGVSWSAAVS